MESGFKKLQIYQKSIILVEQIYELCRNQNLNKDFALCQQIQRAAISIPANIAEGYGRKSKKDFAYFLSISLGSANETLAFLDVIHSIYSIEVGNQEAEGLEIIKMLHSFRRSLLRA